jgi:hypothetical protein
MIYVLQDETGQYDDYETFVETVLQGPDSADIDKLGVEFGKLRPRQAKWSTAKFAKWLIENKGFEKVDYRLFVP